MAKRKLRGRPFIAVAGNMGAGKTTLLELLRETFDLEPYPEPNALNPYLSDFYGDMKRWAFHSQVYFLTKKFALHQELTRSPHAVIQDRTIYEDAEIFAENLYRQRKMSLRDYRTYRELYSSVIQDLGPPDLMIYLECSLATIKKRVKLRGRREEQQLPRTYLARLHALYEEWFERYDLSKVLVIESDSLDYLEDLFDRAALIDRVQAALAGSASRRA